MTRTEGERNFSTSTTTTHYSPRRLKLDKENVQHARRSSPKLLKTPKYSTYSSTMTSLKNGSSTASLSPSVSSRVFFSTSPPPLQPQQQQHKQQQHSFGTRTPTPTGTSRLLREHFAQLTVQAPTPQQDGTTNTGPASVSSSVPPRRRLLDGGPVRLLTPSHYHHHPRNNNKGTNNKSRRMMDGSPVRVVLQYSSDPSSMRRLYHPTPNRNKKQQHNEQNQPQRLGIDGTHQTPSKELLQSTHASRNQQAQKRRIVPVVESSSSSSSSPMVIARTDNTNNNNEDNASNSTNSSTNSVMGSSFSSFSATCRPATMTPIIGRERLNCMDPVAFTLWKGDDDSNNNNDDDDTEEEKQDWTWSDVQQDPSTHTTTTTTTTSSCGSSCGSGHYFQHQHQHSQHIPKVSSNLLDIYDRDHWIEIPHPIPIRARYQPPMLLSTP